LAELVFLNLICEFAVFKLAAIRFFCLVVFTKPLTVFTFPASQLIFVVIALVEKLVV